MKKLHYFPMIILLIATIFAISCTKESANLSSGISSSPGDQLPVVSEIGSIVDFGLINPNTRVMSTTLNAQSFTLNGANYDISGTSALVNLTYYVSDDAQIPAGEYLFSNSDPKSPFTFDSAVFSGAVDGNGDSIPSEKIVDGSVTVTQNGSEYLFAFQGHLESGTIFTGNAKGSLTYTDNNIY